MNKNDLGTSIPSFIPIIAGGVSGCCTRLVCQPLDVIKIRFQLQVEPIDSKCSQAKYRSILQSIRVIFREEGLTALWRGHLPAQALSLSYGVIQFGVFETMVTKARKIPQLEGQKVKVEFVSGFTSGCVATFLSFPLDTIRTRLIAQGKNKAYDGATSGLKKMIMKEGLTSWWKGLTPSLLQIGPYSGFQFASYHFFKRLFSGIDWLYKDNTSSLTLSGSLVAGSLSGFSAKIITYPLDLARKRMQIQGFQDARVGYGKNFICTSFLNCTYKTVKEEGPLGLFKGLTPALIKAAIVNALIFASYEKTYSFLCSIYL